MESPPRPPLPPSLPPRPPRPPLSSPSPAVTITGAGAPPTAAPARRASGSGLTFWRAWCFAGLTIGVLDIADALLFYGARGAAPHVIFQSVASGLLGRSAFAGGIGVELLGGVLHFSVAFIIALVYLAASRRLRTLAEHPWVWGPVYGLAVWFVMYHVVIPLSRASAGPQPWPVLLDEIGIHLLGVGLPAALFAARVRRAGS